MEAAGASYRVEGGSDEWIGRLELMNYRQEQVIDRLSRVCQRRGTERRDDGRALHRAYPVDEHRSPDQFRGCQVEQKRRGLRGQAKPPVDCTRAGGYHQRGYPGAERHQLRRPGAGINEHHKRQPVGRHVVLDWRALGDRELPAPADPGAECRFGVDGGEREEHAEIYRRISLPGSVPPPHG